MVSIREHDAMVHTDGNDLVVLISLIVHGEPAPQGSKRWVGRMIEDNPKTKPWRSEVCEQMRALGVETLLGPLRVELEFYFQHRKGHFGTGRNAGTLKDSAPDYQTTYPDIDKLTRTILDALTQSALIRDDGQVASLTATKRYARTPGVHIKIRPL
jgi:Holliday junction resolvase RusA-like endonuclease